MMLRIASVLLVVISLIACGPSRSVVLEGNAGWPFENMTVEKAVALKPAASLPLLVGIYYADQEFWGRVLAKKGVAFDQFASQLAGIGAVTRVITLPKAQSNKVNDIRALGALNGVDAVLVMEHKISARFFPNRLSLLYLTIIGYWLFPGHNVEAFALTKASIWDVKTGYLYMTAQGEGNGSTFSSGGYLEDSGVPGAIAEAVEASLKSLFDDITLKIPMARERAQKARL